MATIDLVKTALKSTTRMSLNERFQRLRQNQMRRQTIGGNALNSNKLIQNTNRLQLRQGSQKNRRLALQMANRPAVLAALGPDTSHQMQSNVSIHQRLGVKRFNAYNNNNNNQFPNGFKNFNNRNPKRNLMNRSNLNYNNALNRNRNFGQNFVRNQNRRNNTQNIGVIVGVRRKGFKQNRLLRTQPFKGQTNAMKAGPKQKRRFVGQQTRNQNQAKPGLGMKKRFRLNRNFNATNAGKQSQVKRQNVKPNREQLDSDLDAYMAKTKSHLDADIDAYMAQTN